MRARSAFGGRCDGVGAFSFGDEAGIGGGIGGGVTRPAPGVARGDDVEVAAGPSPLGVGCFEIAIGVWIGGECGGEVGDGSGVRDCTAACGARDGVGSRFFESGGNDFGGASSFFDDAPAPELDPDVDPDPDVDVDFDCDDDGREGIAGGGVVPGRIDRGGGLGGSACLCGSSTSSSSTVRSPVMSSVVLGVVVGFGGGLAKVPPTRPRRSVVCREILRFVSLISAPQP